ncbi:uncharacterized protein BP5553_03342 [Venustampulla echinocandica]|uniref:HPt domain-containing protein n=1 Tax=Venustampulla echinocandica TaxID=2656787 RepID=A0A370TTZ5_9HELO|nr:uncharacterized protein BP5553_03342 [Venustampulla echinocandica]RDL39002.1 hypothetical protein BP5553_03342 [Venustampulla echinocandica]
MPSDPHEEERSEAGSLGLPDLGDGIDALTFEQILEMDEDEEEREFSKSIVFGFFEQAEQTFTKMDNALKQQQQQTNQIIFVFNRELRDLEELSSLGHFLKGSSATLGLTKVKDSCEKIQHYGQMKDEAGINAESDEDLCLSRIRETLVTVKEEYAEAEKVLRRFFAG